MKPFDGVLLVGHGTSDPTGTKQFFELGRLLESRLDPIPVQPCLLELQSPTIGDGWNSLVAAGCQRVLAAPLLLFSAGHAKRDIPDALQSCSAGSDITYLIARPLSRAPEILDLLELRVRETAAKTKAQAISAGQAIVLVGRGSYDPCAQADLKLLCALLKHRLKSHAVRPAYYAMAKPDLTQVFAELAQDSSVDTVIVQPHLLFDGLIYRNLITQVESARSLYPRLQWMIGNYLGPDPLIAAALHRRLNQSFELKDGWCAVGSS